MNGSSTCTMPTCTPIMLKSSFCGSPTSPSARSRLFTSPFLPRITSHANVRTSTLVQKGTSSSTVSTRRARGVVVVIRYARG